MSLDVYLNVKEPQKKKSSGIFIREGGRNVEITAEEWNERFPDKQPVVTVEDDNDNFEVYSANITHNLGEMAKEAGIYHHLWRPEEIEISKAIQLIEPLREGLHLLKIEPDRFKKLNPDNGWGSYGGLVEFVQNYLDACYENPDAEVEVWK